MERNNIEGVYEIIQKTIEDKKEPPHLNPCLTAGRLSPVGRGSNSRNAFTLIELIMVIVLLAIISFPVYQVLSIGILTWQRGTGQISTRQDARLAFDRMNSNIRQGNSLTILSAESISFVFDYDSDGDNDSFEYYRNSADSTLREEINNLPVGGTLVVSGLSSLNFSWITGLSNILLDIQITTSDSQGNSSMLQTAVLPRSVWQ